MQDIFQKRKELAAAIALLTEQVKELQKHKLRLEDSIVLLNRESRKKADELRRVSGEIQELKGMAEKVRTDMEAWRRQEIEAVIEEVASIRRSG